MVAQDGLDLLLLRLGEIEVLGHSVQMLLRIIAARPSFVSASTLATLSCSRTLHAALSWTHAATTSRPPWTLRNGAGRQYSREEQSNCPMSLGHDFSY